jgi:hypothetical protein
MENHVDHGLEDVFSMMEERWRKKDGEWDEEWEEEKEEKDERFL